MRYCYMEIVSSEIVRYGDTEHYTVMSYRDTEKEDYKML